MRSIPNITVHPPTVVFTVMLLLIDRSLLSFIPLAAAVLHECGHLAAMTLFGVEVNEIEFTFFGMEIRTARMSLGHIKKTIVFFAGAAVNLISAAAVYFSSSQNFELCFFGGCSACLAILNLLPIESLDGGCILREALLCAAPSHAHIIGRVVSAVTLIALWLFAVYILLVFGGNLSMMLFCIYLFVTLFMR